MNILVTGAFGFIGSTLVPYLLSRGHHVRALDILLYGGEGLLSSWSHPSLQFSFGDISDQLFCLQALQNIDAVIHLAAIVGEPACKIEPDLSKEVNYAAAVRLARDARQMGVPLFLFASTASVYGSVPQGQLCTEESIRSPLGIYAQAKADAEDDIGGMTSFGHYLPLILRFGTAYGISQRMRFDTLVNQFAMEAANSGRLHIFRADAMRPYCHVRDIASAVERILTWGATIQRRGVMPRDMPYVFNVGGHNRSKRDLADWLQDNLPHLKINYMAEPTTDPRDYAVDWANSRLAKLDWAPTKCPEEGMAEVIETIKWEVFRDTSEGRWRNV